MKKLLFILSLITYLSSLNCEGQYTVLFNFSGTNGSYPSGILLLAGNKLYGTTQEGGVNNKGCIFSIDTSGNGYKDLHDFDSIHGMFSQGGLTLLESKLYGTAALGGYNGGGIIFSIDTNGSQFRDIFDFGGGSWPSGSLTLSGNKLYGSGNLGVYAIDTNGSDFKNLSLKNRMVSSGSLAFSGNKLFGLSMLGGANDSGFVFYIDTTGNSAKDLFDFSGANGGTPNEDALLLSGITIYGMTTKGGINHSGCIFSIDTNGTSYTNLHDFNWGNGGYPKGSLTLYGNALVGTTFLGGANSQGCIFSIHTNGGGYTDLFDFDGVNGSEPWNMALTPSGNVFYGTASYGGTPGNGVIFRFKKAGLGITNLPTTTASINVYPNPSSGVFTLQAKSKELRGKSIIEIYNVLGEKVYTSTLPQTPKGASNTIDLSSQPNGVYLYRIVATDGSLAGEGKMVIAK